MRDEPRVTYYHRHSTCLWFFLDFKVKIDALVDILAVVDRAGVPPPAVLDLDIREMPYTFMEQYY